VLRGAAPIAAVAEGVSLGGASARRGIWPSWGAVLPSLSGRYLDKVKLFCDVDCGAVDLDLGFGTEGQLGCDRPHGE